VPRREIRATHLRHGRRRADDPVTRVTMINDDDAADDEDLITIVIHNSFLSASIYLSLALAFSLFFSLSLSSLSLSSLSLFLSPVSLSRHSYASCLSYTDASSMRPREEWVMAWT